MESEKAIAIDLRLKLGDTCKFSYAEGILQIKNAWFSL